MFRNLGEDYIYTIVMVCVSVSFNKFRYCNFRVRFPLDVVPYEEEYRSVYAPVLSVCNEKKKQNRLISTAELHSSTVISFLFWVSA
jgi:hypothetical protein